MGIAVVKVRTMEEVLMKILTAMIKSAMVVVIVRMDGEKRRCADER